MRSQALDRGGHELFEGGCASLGLGVPPSGSAMRLTDFTGEAVGG